MKMRYWFVSEDEAELISLISSIQGTSRFSVVPERGSFAV